MTLSLGEKLREAIKDVLECKVCKGEFTNPKNLPCGHAFCATCIDNTHAANKDPMGPNASNCPLCRRTFVLDNDGAAALATNFHLQDMKDYLDVLEKGSSKEEEKRNCEMCLPSISDATWSCIDCALDLCEECKRKHGMVRATSQHEVKQISGETEPLIAMRKKKIFCPVHKDKELELYCKQCKTATCYSCSCVEHHGHKFDHLWKTAEDTREQISNIKEKSVEFLERQKEDKNQMKRIGEFGLKEKEKAEKSIRATATEMIRMTREKERILLDELDVSHMLKKKQLEHINDDIQFSLGSAASLINYSQSLAEYGSDAHVVSEFGNVVTRSKELFCRSSELPTEEELKIEFKSNNNIPDLFHDLVLGTFVTGSIKADSEESEAGDVYGVLDEDEEDEEDEGDEEYMDTANTNQTNSIAAFRTSQRPQKNATTELTPSESSSDRPPPLPNRNYRDDETNYMNTVAETHKDAKRNPKPFVQLPELDVDIENEFHIQQDVTGE